MDGEETKYMTSMLEFVKYGMVGIVFFMGRALYFKIRY
jgi:hypothetical protein